MSQSGFVRLTALAVLLLSSCKVDHRQERSEAQPNGPVGITVVDSVRLQDTDTAFLARPAGIAVTAQGDLFLSDNANKQIFRFSRDGRFVRTISRRGSGPGEVESVGSIALDGDSLLVVKNMARMRVEVFDAATSEFRWGRQLPQRAFEITSKNGAIYAAGLMPNASTSLVSFSTATDSIKHLGWIPKILRDNPVLMGPFGTVSHDVSGHAIAEAFEASDYVYYQTKGLPRDSMTLPTIRRRGAATEALLATAADTSKGREALFMSSVPMLTRFVSDSVIAVVHSDVELSNNLFIGKYYVSLIDVRQRRVCIDLPLALPVDPLPRLTMIGDTLVAIVQHVPAKGSAGTFVVRMHVSSKTCPWNYVSR
jgi:hypothetical protein